VQVLSRQRAVAAPLLAATMRFAKEPEFVHGSAPRTGILLMNLGTPDEPTPKAVRSYLRQFLTDPRVIEIPRLPWRLLLESIILPLRAKRSAAKYQSIWTQQGSPLKVYTEIQAKLLKGRLGALGTSLLVETGMRYGNPSIASALDRLKAGGATRILVLPLYPQYSATTVATGQDQVFAWASAIRDLPELRFVNAYHDHPAYIRALAQHLRAYVRPESRTESMQAYVPRFTVFSFHGLPRRTLTLGDPYHCQCLKTGRLLAEALNLRENEYQVTFQSRFGRAEWLQPYTEPTLIELARKGTREVDVFCPGFPCDCLETLEEINIEARHAFLAAGGKDFHYVPALNDDPQWIEALAKIASDHLIGWVQADDENERTASCQRALDAGALR
jgi:ferrochelatase